MSYRVCAGRVGFLSLLCAGLLKGLGGPVGFRVCVEDGSVW